MNRLSGLKKLGKLRIGIWLILCSELALAGWSPLSSSQYQLSDKARAKLAILNATRSSSRQLTPNEQGAPAPKNIYDLKGYNELVPYVSPSPDQEDAGTCLFMSLTGIAEWFLNRKNGSSFKQDGVTDLSERWWVNVNSRVQSRDTNSQWATDTIYLFNQFAGVLNSTYRYTKGWFQLNEGIITKSDQQNPVAKFGTTYNWIDESGRYSLKTVRLPTFQRIILHQDSSKNPWSFGEGNRQLVDKVKKSLQLYKSPVQVIYNHLGYWHSVFIIGFDDQLPTYNCYFIRETRAFYQREISNTQIQWQQTSEIELKKELQNKLDLLKINAQKLESVHKRNGGCQSQGMFYVRDSQYSDSSEEIYNYDLNHLQYSKPYSKRIILREYSWLSDLSSHVIQITSSQ